ncbi:hypothetical protein OPIT5_08050 [Opitutaceae bacterium TAV5]|nr:hypothetical protein OPIT5_08050 [Opitutaceae bacterium TAV5]
MSPFPSRERSLRLSALLALLMITSAAVRAQAAGAVLDLAPVADTYLQGGDQADTNFGGNATLHVRGSRNRSYQRLAWLRFDLTQAAHRIQAATLNLSLASIYRGRPASTLDIFGLAPGTAPDWDEATLTNANAAWPATSAHEAPANAILLGSIAVPATGGASGGAIFSLSTPALVTFLEQVRTAPSRSATLVLREPGDSPNVIAFASKENTLYSPIQLSLTLDAPVPPPDIPDPVFPPADPPPPAVTLLRENGATSTHATIQAALDAARPGDTVRLPAGTWHEPITFRVSGQPGRPVTLTAEDNARVVIDAADPFFQSDPSGRWQQDPDSGFWRASPPLIAPLPGHAITTWISRHGTASEETGRSDRLLAAYASLQGLADAPRGEGTFRERDALYVKLDGGENPNTVGLNIARAHAVIDLNGHSHLHIRGLELRNASWAGVVIGGPATDIHLSDLVIRNCFRGITTRGDTTAAVSIHGVHIENGMPPAPGWVWNGGYTSGVGQHPQDGSDAFAPWRGFGISLTNARDSEISGSLVSGQWDGLTVKSSHNVRVHHNTLRNIIDDGIELESASQSDVFVYNNHFHDVFAGISVTPNGPGPIYIYRNVVEATRRSKASPGSGNRYASYGIKSGHNNLGVAENIKFYHNTFYSQSFSVWEKLGDPAPNRWHGYDFVNNIFYSFGARPQNVNFRGADTADTGGDNHWEANLYNHDRPAGEPAALTDPDLAGRFVDPLTPDASDPRDLRLRDGSPGRGDGSDHPARQGWPDSVTAFPGGRDRGAWQASMAPDAIGAPAAFLNATPAD